MGEWATEENMTEAAFSLTSIKEPNPMTTASGEQHGLMKIYSNSVPDNEFKRFKEKDRAEMKKRREDDGKMVKAIYINTKDPSRRLQMPYNQWDGDPILCYKFIPDQEYEVPKGLVKLVNSKKEHKRSGILDPKTNQPALIDQEVPGEHRFVAVGF